MAAPRRPSPDKVIDAAMRLAAERRWYEVTLREIADAAGIGLGDLHAMFASKSAIIGAFTTRIDAQVIAGTDADALGEPARDRKPNHAGADHRTLDPLDG